MSNDKQPEIRFPGFAEDWEERKLKELGDIQTGNTPPTSNLDNYSTDGVLWVTPTDIKTLVISDTAKKLSEVGVTKARIAKAGSILVTSIASIGKNTLVTMDAGFNQQINSLTPTPKNDSYFLLTQSEKWSEKMKKTAASATMQIVNKTDFSNISTFVPVHKEEQQKIGSFFKQLDETITLHQRKLDLLKETKKGFLQKMFPKNGAKVPEIRFPGFTEDWEERKLSEVANHRGGTAIEKYFKEDGKYKVISIGSYGLDSKYVDQNIRAVSNEVTDSRVVRNGELTMVLNDKTANGTIIGRSLLIEEDNKYVINQRNEIISPKENFDSNFAYTILNGPFRESVKRIVQGGTQIYVNYPAVSNLVLKLPDVEEQKKIGLFFKQLDDTIALHQRKLDLLKETKKGFLQKMFV